jgi:rare lipoprotein A (peptidoglycan hydrolase)
MVSRKIRRAKRVRLVRIALSASALAAMVLPVKIVEPAEAKTPGSTYCYYGTCHRVMTIAETQALEGVEESIVASHYDDCSHDRYNPCGLTSSGEKFHPDRPDNAASPIYPDGTMLLVWSPESERALVVRVNNAGPYWGDRKLDLSRAAAEKLGFDGKGVANVRVRVIKAPEPEEATYVANRDYPPVPGDIGEYGSLQDARTGMAAALALQASAGSPLAPVTTAHAFARPGRPAAELLVAEAPQALGRVSTTIASLEPEPEQQAAPLSLGALLAQSLKSSSYATAQSRWRTASLSLERGMNQSVWDEDLVDTAPVGDDATEDAAAAVVAIAAPAPQPAVRPATSEETKAKEEKVVAAKEPAPKKQRAARREKKEKVASASRRSRKSQARNEARRQPTRTAEAERGYARERVADSSDRRESWGGNRSRNTQQLTTMGLRAQSSSTL